MDSQSWIEYEICDIVSYKRFYTRSRDEAFAYFEKGWFIFEHHISICRPSIHNSTRVDVSMEWNNSPEFKEK